MSFLGILMLQTRFPRPLGDVGHPGSWAMPVRFFTVAGASPRRVVQENDPALLQPFVDAGHAAVLAGARALTTSCGFLIRHQAALQAALQVPVWTSSLLCLPRLSAPGVLTIDADALGPAELRAAGAAESTPIEGLPRGGVLQRTLLGDLPTLDAAAAEAETVTAARNLVRRHPHVQQLVLECTNLPPYAQAVGAATDRPVHHLMTLVHERYAAL